MFPLLYFCREAAKVAGNVSDSEGSKNGQISVTFTVSSNFEVIMSSLHSIDFC